MATNHTFVAIATLPATTTTTTAAVTTNATNAFLSDVPDGFWTLFVVSIVVIVFIVFALSWMANPRAMRHCLCACCSCRKHWRTFRKGASSFTQSLKGDEEDEHDDGPETWWGNNPSTQ